MAVQPQAYWQDLLDHIASREREYEIAISGPDNETDSPFWDHSEVELDLYEYSLRTLRETPDDKLDAIGSTAVIANLGQASPFTLPQNTIRVLSVTIQISGSVSKWYPARYVSPAQWFQLSGADSSTTVTRYTFYGGQLYLPSDTTSANIILLQEPALTDFQANKWIIPPAGYDEYVVDLVHKRLQVIDNMPGGRV